MKKFVVLTLALVMALTCLTGCGDPVAADFENFLNVEMVDVNANYETIKTEVAKWAELETDAEYVAHLKDVLLPLCDEALDMLANINPETEEVQAIKAKYVKVMDLYKEGFGLMLTGAENVDEATINNGTDKIGEAVAALDDYNAALEELAKETGYTVEY